MLYSSAGSHERLGFWQQRQTADIGFGRCHRRREQGLKVSGNALDRIGSQARGIVVKLKRQAIRGLDGQQL